MKTTNDNFGGSDYPPMTLPKQENADSRFDERCKALDAFISICYNFFMYYAGQTKVRGDELRSTVCLDGIFLQMFTDIIGTDHMRGKLLFDEQITLFENRLKVLSNMMRPGTLFIRTSNETLTTEVQFGKTCFADARSDVVEGFMEQSEWLKTFTSAPGNVARARALADKLSLNYSMKQFGCMGDNFEQHANMVFNGLMVLAIPSMQHYGEDEFAQVFQNSISMFKRGYLWQAIEARLEEDLEHDLSDAICDSYSAKIARVKELWWKPTRLAIRVLLGKFGITYVHVLSPDKMGLIGRQLYERLNGIRIDKKDESPLERMTNEDLCRYLKLEAELQFFAAKIEKYRALVNDPMPQDDYFEPEQPRQKIRNAIYKTIHERGDNKREVLYAQSHWFAIHKVFEYHQMCCGTLKDFDYVMNKWFPTPPHPCDYDSLKNMKVADIRQKCYTDWSAATSANVPYRRVALTLAKHLREEGVIH